MVVGGARAGMAGEQLAYLEMPAGFRTRPVVVSSPHSGTHYPPELVAGLAVPAEQLRCLEDGPIDRLVAGCAAAGATVLAAVSARAYVDLNRAPLEIDPALLGQPGALARVDATARVQAGLGIVPSRIGALELYRAAPGAGSLRARLEQAYLPYHRRLRELLRDRAQAFGAALLLDCHSMPVEAAGTGRSALDVAVGDRFGASCERTLADLVVETLAAHGLKVARNRPYAGGFITEHHGKPTAGRHALQLEIRRDLFMDPQTHRLTAGATRIAEALEDVVRRAGDLVAACGTMPAGLARAQPPPAEVLLPELLRAAD